MNSLPAMEKYLITQINQVTEAKSRVSSKVTGKFAVPIATFLEMVEIFTDHYSVLIPLFHCKVKIANKRILENIFHQLQEKRK